MMSRQDPAAQSPSTVQCPALARYAESFEPMHYWGRWVDELQRVDGQWLFMRREVVGVGQIMKGDPPPAEPFPGHPGRLA